MPLPQAVIAYVNSEHRAARQPSELAVEALDSLALALAAMKSCRDIQSRGGSILYVDFITDGITRRRYVDGRVGLGFARMDA